MKQEIICLIKDLQKKRDKKVNRTINEIAEIYFEFYIAILNLVGVEEA